MSAVLLVITFFVCLFFWLNKMFLNQKLWFSNLWIYLYIMLWCCINMNILKMDSTVSCSSSYLIISHSLTSLSQQIPTLLYFSYLHMQAYRSLVASSERFTLARGDRGWKLSSNIVCIYDLVMCYELLSASVWERDGLFVSVWFFTNWQNFLCMYYINVSDCCQIYLITDDESTVNDGAVRERCL